MVNLITIQNSLLNVDNQMKQQALLVNFVQNQKGK